MKSFYQYLTLNNTKESNIILIMVASIMLPYQLSVILLVCISIYLILKMKTLKKPDKRSLILVLFSIYLAITSIIFTNYLGLLISIGFILFALNIAYYTKYLTKDTFEKALNLIIVLSIISSVYALFEQLYYYLSIPDMKSYLDIQNKPYHRIHSFFFNANYYAMILNFVEAIILYKITTLKNKKYLFHYLFMMIFTLFIIFLTGGRIALMLFFVSIIAYFILIKNYKVTIITLIIMVLGLVTIIIYPNLLPRLDNVGFSLGRRQEIYRTALLMLNDMWLFGQGPLTYLNSHEIYLPYYLSIYGSANLNKLGIATQHAHTIFLEPLISFGLIGTLIINSYFFLQLKDIITKYKNNPKLAALILTSLLITIMSCIVDFTIFWVQTGLLLMFIFGATKLLNEDTYEITNEKTIS